MADTFFTPQYAAAPWDWNPVKTGIDAYLNVRKSQMDAQENERQNQELGMKMRMNAELLPVKIEAAKLEAEKFRSEISETNLKISRARQELDDEKYLTAAAQNAGKYAGEIFNYDGYYGAAATPAAPAAPNKSLPSTPIANFSSPKNALTQAAAEMPPSSKRPDGSQQPAAGGSVAEPSKPKISPVPDQAQSAPMNEVAQSMGNEKTPTRPRMVDLIDRFDEEDRRFLDFVGSTGPDSRERKSLALVAEAHRLNNRLPLLKFAGVTEDQFEKVRRMDRKLVEEFDTIRNVYSSDEEALNFILKRERDKIEGKAAPTRSEQLLSQIKELGKEAAGSPLYVSLESEYTQARRNEKGITAVDDFFENANQESRIKFAQQNRAPLPDGTQDYDKAMSAILGQRAALLGEVMASKDRRFVDLTKYDTKNGALTPEALKAYQSDIAAARAYADKAGGAPVIYDGMGLSVVKKGGGSLAPATEAPEQPTTKYDEEVNKASANRDISRAKKLKAEIDQLLQQSDNVSPTTYISGMGPMVPARMVDRSPAEKQTVSRELKMRAAKKQKELDSILKSYPDALK
jgi:hypothetical protein